MQNMELTRKKRRIVAWFLFLVYFTVLFYFLFFSESLGRGFSEREYQYNLVPLKEIGRFLKYAHILGKKAVWLNLAGNVIAFMPFGFFLPVFSRRCKEIWYVLLYSFELSLLVETIQLVTKVGSFDVDDLLLNTIGGVCGYLVYGSLQKIRRKWNVNKKTQKREL